MNITSKELIVANLGITALHNYEEVKRFYMRLGVLLPAALLERVGGRAAYPGEGCDGVTLEGKWEFCVQGNTKNHHGNQADMLRCPGRCVQILGKPRTGWMSGGEFLARHGVDGGDLEPIVWAVAETCANEARQTRLAV